MDHKFIPYGRQYIDEEDIKEVVKTLKSDYLTTGPKVKEFEDRFANYVGCRYAVAIANGTAALHAACFAAGIEPGDEAITTSMTFAATSNSVLYLGGKPVFADILPDTWNLDPDEVEKLITPKTRALIPVDFTGQPAQIFKLKEIARKHNLVVIEDAAHSLGASLMDSKGHWHKVGSAADITTFSFHPVKHITTAEGGMVCTDSEAYYKKLLLFRTHGITREKDDLFDGQQGKWYYEQQLLGYNYRMSDIQAAMGVSQLKKLDGFIRRRLEIAERYNNAFSQGQLGDRLTVPFQAPDVKSSYHIYVLKFHTAKIGKTRKEIFENLSAKNIGVNVHYIPVYYHPYYKSLGYNKGLCPIAEKLYEEIITLPLHPGMSDDDVEYVIDSVAEVVC